MAQRFIDRHTTSISAVLTIAVAALVFYAVYAQQITVPDTLKKLETVTNDFLLQTLNTNILTPPPLRDTDNHRRGELSSEGVVAFTNTARTDQSIPPLRSNVTLNAIAEQKLKDMFFYQYFEHVSPLGVGAGDLAHKNNYDYIIIGENLAMGNFVSDEALVTAWMQSPGHRANILNPRYQEIGIAVGEGIYEGKLTWIAVQEFGLPMNVCTRPVTAHKDAIALQKSLVTVKEEQLNTLKAEIDALESKAGADYSAKVEAYNTLVKDYNAQVLDLKAKIAAYNTEVAQFNRCAQAQ